MDDFSLKTLDIQSKLIEIRNQAVLLDRDVARLYGVETRALNQAVKRNPDRFPSGFVFQMDSVEFANWKSQIVTSNLSDDERASLKMGIRRPPFVFTERGLYMLATVLKGERAANATLAIINTYAKVRALKRELLELHKEGNKKQKMSMMKHFGELLTDIVMPDPDTTETESSLELNFFIGKLKHTVRRIKKGSRDER